MQIDYTDPFAAQQAQAQASLQAAQQAKQYRTPQGPGMVGRVYVGAHPLQGLAELLRTRQAANQEEEAMQQLQGIGAQRQEAQNRDMSAFVDILRGKPAQPAFEAAGPAPQGAPQEGGYTVPAQAAKAGDPYAAYGMAMSSQSPMVRQIGMQGMAHLPQMEATKAEREANREFQAEQREADRQMRRDIAQQNLDLRREVRNAGAQKAGGDQWKYDAGSDTWVQPPNEQFPMGRATPNVGKVAAGQNFDYLASNFVGDEKNPGIVDKTPQGGWLGIGGKLGTGTQSAKEFDNAKEQMSTELRKIFRIPGEGALSDKEQAQYGIQLPSRDNDPDLNRQIVKDLRFRVANSVNPQGVNPLQPNTPKPEGRTPKPVGPKVGDVQDGFVFMGGNPADPKSWKKQ